MIWLGLIFAAASPFFLWILENFFPYPFLIEEVFKFVLVINILNSNQKGKIKLAALFGLVFSLSETFLYFLNIFQSSFFLFLKRIFFTSFLHMGTVILMTAFGQKNKKLGFLGLILAVLIHWGYNFILLRFFPR